MRSLRGDTVRQQRRWQTEAWVTACLLAAAFPCGGALRALAVVTKPVFYHDESHTYQIATCHTGRVARIIYQHDAPYGKWTQANEWQRLLKPEERFCFRLIAADTLAYDVHPPLYYWLLHLACLALGSHYWTGVLLNALVDAVTLLALYRLVVCATGNRSAAAVTAFLWAVSAAPVQVATVEARMYSVLTLLCVLLAVQVVQLFRAGKMDDKSGRARLLPSRGQRPSVMLQAAERGSPGGSPSRQFCWYRWTALILTILAGALTHHHFALFAGGTLAWCAVTQFRSRPHRVAGLMIAISVAYAALFAIHPFFRGTGYKHLTDAHLPDTAGFETRLRQTLEALAHVFIERRFGTSLPYAAIVSLALLVPIVFVLGFRSVRRLQSDERWPARYLLFVGAWVTVAVVALYLTGVSPAHAMSYRYLAMSWPFLAIAAGVFVATRTPGALRATSVSLACLLTLITGSASAWMQWHHLEVDPNAPAATALLRTADHVVIDNVSRGHWPRPIWRLRDDAQVIVAMPNDLLRRPMTWLAEAPPGTLYVSPAQSATQAREKLITAMKRTRGVRFVAHVHGIGDVFEIGSRAKITHAGTSAAAPRIIR